MTGNELKTIMIKKIIKKNNCKQNQFTYFFLTRTSSFIFQTIIWFNFVSFGIAEAQSSISGRILNGTTNQPVINQKVDLLTFLGQKKSPDTKEAFTKKNGTFSFKNVELAADSPHILLRTIYQGVNYNLSLASLQELKNDQVLTVYETSSEIQAIDVSMPVMLAMASGNSLLIEQQYILNNNSRPKRTLVHPQMTFQFDTPPPDKINGLKTSILGLAGIPLPQRPLERKGGGFRINHPMKPGLNEIWVSYRVNFNSNSRALSHRMFDGIEHSRLFVRPSSLQVTGKGIESTGIDSRTQSATFHIKKIAKDGLLDLLITGDAPEHSADDGHDHGKSNPEFKVVRLPNPVFKQNVFILGAVGGLSLAIIFYALGQQSRQRIQKKGRTGKKKR